MGSGKIYVGHVSDRAAAVTTDEFMCVAGCLYWVINTSLGGACTTNCLYREAYVFTCKI